MVETVESWSDDSSLGWYWNMAINWAPHRASIHPCGARELQGRGKFLPFFAAWNMESPIRTTECLGVNCSSLCLQMPFFLADRNTIHTSRFWFMMCLSMIFWCFRVSFTNVLLVNIFRGRFGIPSIIKEACVFKGFLQTPAKKTTNQWEKDIIAGHKNPIEVMTEIGGVEKKTAVWFFGLMKIFPIFPW